MHVAADNYFLPAAMGIPAPAETGIVGKEYKTAAAFEKKKVTRDEIIAEVEKSFAFLKKSIGERVRRQARRRRWKSSARRPPPARCG